MRRLAALVVTALAGALGCSSAPDGFLGVAWGDSSDTAEAQLGLSCNNWRDWGGGEGFEVCDDGLRAVFEHPATTTLVRRGGALEGLQLRFEDCAAYRPDLMRGLRDELGTDEGVTYQVWSSGEAVHLEQQGPDCLLTVAGPAFGEAFQSYRMARGLGGLQLGP